MRVLAFDLGLNIGYALLHPGQSRPEVGHFRIQHRALDLGLVALAFNERAVPIMKEMAPDYVVRATRFISRTSTPVAIGPYYGLSMWLDAICERWKWRHGEISESDARKAFLGKLPRKGVKDAVRLEFESRGWGYDNEHIRDAIVVGLHTLEILQPRSTLTKTPLFQGLENENTNAVAARAPKPARKAMGRKNAAG